ncbi:hypothetical protein DL764_000918 [Monosporascus ibericus]|uniref:Uncharacterized protein n=1 Tax=Monosporascus ibericus TaxID=155417 RepID=A0A4Q4TWR4_9PEZI|nr:hypothetical protein DL764_000918 [Monosporascus ibericus]
MQTVPSLIGTGTAVAAAATGLVFGQLADERHQSPTKPNRRKSALSVDFLDTHPSSRPATTSSPVGALDNPHTDESNALRNQYHPPSLNTTQTQLRNPRRPSPPAQTPPPLQLATGRPTAKQGEVVSSTPISESTRDSYSSNGSWIRRFSLRALSRHESGRSSTGPDSPSIFSHNSGAPILGFKGHAPQLPPNKLVKRASAGNGGNAGSVLPRGSRSQMTLRRPATSHQRSATLQQQMNAEAPLPLPQPPMKQQRRPRAQTLAAPPPSSSDPVQNSPSRWKSFWHSRLSRLRSTNPPLKLGDSGAPPRTKRIRLGYGRARRAYLLAPSSIMTGDEQISMSPGSEGRSEADSPKLEQFADSSEETPSQQPKRSYSVHFSSPNWLSRTGSIRRLKRGGGDAAGGHQRDVSDPSSADIPPEQSGDRPRTTGASNGKEPSQAESDLTSIFRPPVGTQKPSSPLRSPLPPLNGFQIDLAQLDSPSMGPGISDEPVLNPTTTRRVHSGASQARSRERASTIASSEYYRGFTSGDDDTDFKTETAYDSFRTTTTASGRRKTLESPVESMFDETPPSTLGNSKPKRLSIQEILGPSYDGGNKIMEEDENLSTPVRGTYAGGETRFLVTSAEPDNEFEFGSTSTEFALSRDARLSLDDDDDLDWAREDESQIYNHLSPPSSMNSRRGSPSLRMALANICGNCTFDPHRDTASERPRSTIFDWAEPVHHDKYDGDGYSFRPKTVHGKHEIDMRGGRAASRRGPIAAHVRSQSVPIVTDPAESSKSTSKFGTWGLSTKNVSEDWDDDFEFEEADPCIAAEKKDDNRRSMIVPPSIQATQPSVRAHSGQIRELSLLVNDLKRLCRLGRDMDLLTGSSASLWREAEGIIALASPDEDSAEETDLESAPSGTDSEHTDRRFPAQGLDGTSFDDFGYDTRTFARQKVSGSGDRSGGRRRSVFSPDDDVFGTWDQAEVSAVPDRPVTPDTVSSNSGIRSSGVAKSVMAAMWSRRSKAAANAENGTAKKKLNFDTNSLKELVKQASELRDALSDLVRKADRITQSPARTPRRERGGGSPAFTRVFDDPTASPTRRLPQSRSSSSILSAGSVSTSPASGLQRMQMMTVK